MKLPSDDECRRVIGILVNETDSSELTEWEYNFIQSNKYRREFTPLQKESIQKLADKYDCD